MKKSILFAFVFCFLFIGGVYAQDSTIKEKPRYLDFVLSASEHSQNHLFMVNYQFGYSPIGKSLGERGGMTNLGINLAKFFSKKIIIAAVADIKLLPGIWNIKPSSNLTNDFNANFIQTYNNPTDSANASVMKNALNGNISNNIIGQNIFNFGLAVSLFPQKYGGILLQVKNGGMGFQVHGVYYNKYVNGGGNDKVAMAVAGNWIYELTFKPVAFAENTYLKSADDDENVLGKSIVVSFYYERLNFKSAEFNGTKLTQIVSNNFINKYGTDHRFGFKIGLALY